MFNIHDTVSIIVSSGSEVCRFNPSRGRCISSERKNPEYDFLRKGSRGSRVVDIRHVKEPQAKIRGAKFVGLFTLYVGSDADDLRC